MSITPLTFTGISQYSTDFQTILTRAVQIANIPVQQLQNKDADVLSRKGLLSGLATSVGNLASSIQALGNTASGGALTAFSSDSTVVSATNTGASSAANYTINSITSAASAASERSTVPLADSAVTPFSASGTVKLVVGSTAVTKTLTDNTLIGVRDWINGLGAGVTASILTTTDGNYLSLNAASTGATTLQLIEDPAGTPVNTLTATNQGSDAVFQLNGIDISQKGNVVNSVVPGLTFSILKASATPVTLSLASDRSQLATTLGNFVNSYNATLDTVNAQIGAGAGLLTGDTVVTQLSNQLRAITSYRAASGGVTNLGDLGVRYDTKGHASVDATVFNALSDTAISDAFTFLGSATSGFGGLSQNLTQFSDPIGGLINIEQEGLDRTDTYLQKQVADLSDRISLMQTAMAAKLHATDSLLGILASQQQTLTASLQGLSLTLYGKNPG